MLSHKQKIALLIVFLSLCMLAFALFKQYTDIATYQDNITTLQRAYTQVRTINNDYQKKVQSLRQLTILANAPDSKNVVVGGIINTYTKKVDGDISIYYKNLTTNESVTIDPDRKYYMASLYKIILTLYVLDQTKNNTINLTDQIGTGSATLEFALNKIITESNNEYAQFLANKYGWQNIEDVMTKRLGIAFRFNKDLTIDVKNVEALFEDIALSLKVSDDESKYLLTLLNDQTKTSKLPKYLPKNIYAHNKTGEFELYSHDAGVFYTPKANYILIFLSKTDNPDVTNEQMATMSKDIYDVLNDTPNQAN